MNTYPFHHLPHTFLMLLATWTIVAQASDLAREQRWANEIVDTIIDGDAINLNDGSHDFLGIYTEATKASQRAAIIMHGTGVHPNWQQVVQPLRTGLTAHGWNTLSIQMPILASDAEHMAYPALYPSEVPARINAAISYLHNKGIKHIVLIGHSQGSLMGAYYLGRQSQGVAALVAIGMSCNLSDTMMNAASSLKTIRLPVLDLYGSDDLATVINDKSACATAAKAAGNTRYTKKMVAGANHFFDGKNKELLDIVANWLNSLPK